MQEVAEEEAAEDTAEDMVGVELMGQHSDCRGPAGGCYLIGCCGTCAVDFDHQLHNFIAENLVADKKKNPDLRVCACNNVLCKGRKKTLTGKWDNPKNFLCHRGLDAAKAALMQDLKGVVRREEGQGIS